MAITDPILHIVLNPERLDAALSVFQKGDQFLLGAEAANLPATHLPETTIYRLQKDLPQDKSEHLQDDGSTVLSDEDWVQLTTEFSRTVQW